MEPIAVGTEIPESWALSVIGPVEMARVSFAYDGRNAWWGHWSSRYLIDSIALSSEDSKRAVEPNRTQGSTWWTVEWPCFEFRASSERLLLVDIEDPRNVSSRLLDRLKPPTLWKLVDAVSSPPKRPWHLFRLDDDEEPDYSVRPLKRWKSRAEGGDYCLGWHEVGSKPVSIADVWVLQRTLDYVRETSGFLGIKYRPMGRGFEITALHPDSPLNHHRVSVGDLLIPKGRVDGLNLSPEDRTISKLRPYVEISLEIVKESKPRKITVRVPPSSEFLATDPL